MLSFRLQADVRIGAPDKEFLFAFKSLKRRVPVLVQLRLRIPVFHLSIAEPNGDVFLEAHSNSSILFCSIVGMYQTLWRCPEVQLTDFRFVLHHYRKALCDFASNLLRNIAHRI